MDQEAFRQACARYATGITIAAVLGADGRAHGLTANSFTSVSWKPPLVLICVDHRSAVHQHFKAARAFSVSVLGEEQKELSVRFAKPKADRFDGVEWQTGQLGTPLISSALAHFECSVSQIVEAGDHTMFVGEVRHASSRDGAPLVYFSRDYRALAR